MQKGNMLSIAFVLELLYMEIRTPNSIHIAICENMFPKFSVYISSNRIPTPSSNPIKNILIGFNIIFFNKSQLLFFYLIFREFSLPIPIQAIPLPVQYHL